MDQQQRHPMIDVDQQIQRDYYLLQSVKGIRNACCHNQCILNDMSAGEPLHNAQYVVRRAVRRAGISQTTAESKLSNERLSQIATALYMHHRLASAEMIDYRTEELWGFIERVGRHSEYYAQNGQVRSGLDFLQQLIRAWYPQRDSNPGR